MSVKSWEYRSGGPARCWVRPVRPRDMYERYHRTKSYWQNRSLPWPVSMARRITALLRNEGWRVNHKRVERIWRQEVSKVYEVDPMVCPKCGGQMNVIAFLTDWAVVDRIIDHLKLTFFAERPPPPHIAYQEVLMAAQAPVEYIS